MKETAVELYIDTPNTDENKRVFDALMVNKKEIEAAFGQSLAWERMDDKQASRVRYVLEQGGLVDKDKWPQIQDATISAMDKLAKALKPYLNKPWSAS